MVLICTEEEAVVDKQCLLVDTLIVCFDLFLGFVDINENREKHQTCFIMILQSA